MEDSLERRVEEKAKETWGYDLTREQRRATSLLCQGKDAIVTLATGGGKSLIYQAFALATGGPVLVISPLLSLIQDQVDSLKRVGVSARDMGEEEEREEEEHEPVVLYYCTPERAVHCLSGERRRDWKLVAVDEAHCVVDWGLDFRPEYAQLTAVYGKRKERSHPVVALTASAPPKMVDEIESLLGMEKGTERVKGTYERENLSFYVVKKGEIGCRSAGPYFDVKWLVRVPCIVYANTRKETESISDQLVAFRSAPYHAGLSPEERESTLDLFMRNELGVIVATIAFGMGINKPDVRSVIHYGPSGSLERYYQEAGRAGRDGKESKCTLLYNYSDFIKRKHAFGKEADSNPSVLSGIVDMESYVYSKECLSRKMVVHFGETPASPMCGKCSVCLSSSSLSLPSLSEEEETALSSVLSLLSDLSFYGKGKIVSCLKGKKDVTGPLSTHSSFSSLSEWTLKKIGDFLDRLLLEGRIRTIQRSLSCGKTYYSLSV